MQNRLLIVLIFMATSLASVGQYYRPQAVIMVIDELIKPEPFENVYLYSKYEKMNLGDTLHSDIDPFYHICPFDESWVFFIDDLPMSYWVHPCRWVFFDVATAEMVVKEANSPPVPYLSNSPLFFNQWEWIINVGMDPTESFSFDVFPNPTLGEVKINLNPINSQKDEELKIYSSTGTLLHKEKLEGSDQNILLDLSNHPKGIYLFSIKTAKRVYQKKILKL